MNSLVLVGILGLALLMIVHETGHLLAARYRHVLVPELNTGQLAQLLRAKYLVDVESFCKVQGQPLFATEIEEQIAERQ